MDFRQRIWMIIIIPIFLATGIDAIRIGWRILKHNEDAYAPVTRIKIWFIKRFEGNKKAEEYQKKLKQDKKSMKDRGYYGIVGGIFYLAISGFFLFLLITQ